MKKRFFAFFLFLGFFPAFAAVKDPTTGIPPFGSISATDFDAINRQNLNANFQIPIVSLPGRAGSSFSYSIVYDSLLWKPEGGAWTPVVDNNGYPLWGWKIDRVGGIVKHIQSTELCGQTTYVTTHEYTFLDPNGTQHGFNVTLYTARPKKPLVICDGSDPSCPCDMNQYQSTPPTGPASDSSGFFLDATNIDTPVVKGPDGKQYPISGQLPPDRNGNYLTWTTIDSATTDWTDTAARRAIRMVKSSLQTNFIVLDSDGTARSFTLNYQNMKIKTAFGCTSSPKVSEYTNNSVNLPVSLVLPNGTSYSFTYEPTPNYSGYVTGRLKRVTLPTGGYFEYQYSGAHGGIDCNSGTALHLTRVVSDGTNSSSWAFDRDGLGNTLETSPQMSYDDAANQAEFTFSGSLPTKAKYFQGTKVSGTLKRTIDTTYASNGTPNSVTTTFNDGNPIKKSKVETSFDSNGNLTQAIEYALDGTPTNPIRTTTNFFITDQAYISHNIVNLVATTIVRDGGPSGTIISRVDFGYDATTGYTCDSAETAALEHDHTNFGCNFFTRGNPTSYTAYLDPITPANPITRNFVYDQLGNLRRAGADCCQLKRWDYSSQTQWSQPNSETSGPEGGPNLVKQWSYYSTTGLVSVATDENLKTNSYAYDIIGRLLSITRSGDGSSLYYVYNDVQRTITTISPIDTGRTKWLTAFFDPLGRVNKTILADDGGTVFSVNELNYDPLSRPYKKRNPYQNAGDPAYWTETRYDALGRVLLIIPPDGSPTSNRSAYSYSGNEITLTDPSGRQRKLRYDSLGRLIATIEPDVLSGQNPLTQETTYTYDVMDHLIGVVQGNQTRTNVFDALGRMISSTTPEAGNVQSSYNEWGEIQQSIDSRGVRTNFTYDGLNRLSQVSYDTNGMPNPENS